MSQQELLRKAIEALETAEIPYMITGSVASSLQGEPRSTHDIDFVVELQHTKIPLIVAAFPASDYHIDVQSIHGAIASCGMFSVIDLREGTKLDFWLLTDEPFDRSRFARRYNESVMGLDLQVSSPEDTVLAKLMWAKLSGGSEKQFVDAVRVYEVQHKTLDFDYIKEWVRRLEIPELWARLQEEAEIT